MVLSVTSISAGREGDNPQSWLQASSLCCWWRGAARSVGMCILDHLFPFINVDTAWENIYDYFSLPPVTSLLLGIE